MKDDELERKKIGLRIKSARVLTGLNQEDFAHRCGFNYTSLRNWEFGRVYPRFEAIRKLIDAFKEFGIFTCVDWILNGAGEGPTFVDKEQTINFEPFNNEVIKAFKKSVERSGEKSIFSTVADNDMKPLFCSGDVIGGIATTIHEIERWSMTMKSFQLSQPFLIKSESNDFQVRWLNFDGQNWWVRSAASYSVEPLRFEVVGTIILHLRLRKAVITNETAS